MDSEECKEECMTDWQCAGGGAGAAGASRALARDTRPEAARGQVCSCTRQYTPHGV